MTAAELFPRTEPTTYFIQGVHGGPVKIGRSLAIAARLRDLQTGSPVPLQVVGTSLSAEREMHRRFADERLYGEFFRPSRRMLEFAALVVGPYVEDIEAPPSPVTGPTVPRRPRPRPMAQPRVDGDEHHLLTVTGGVDTSPLLCLEVAAKRLNVSEKTVRRLINRGALRAVRVGGQFRVADDELAAFIVRQSTGEGTP